MVGFLGGWTTYSTLAVDATLLAKDGDLATCLAYLAATVVGGLALVVAGHDLGRQAGRAMSASSPTLGLALVVAAAGWRGAVARALLIHHIGLRRGDPLPAGHHGGERLGLARRSAC